MGGPHPVTNNDSALSDILRFDALNQCTGLKPANLVLYRVDSLKLLLNKFDTILQQQIIVAPDTPQVLKDFEWQIGLYPGRDSSNKFRIYLMPVAIKKGRDGKPNLKDGVDYYDFRTHYGGHTSNQLGDLYKKNKVYIYDFGTSIP